MFYFYYTVEMENNKIQLLAVKIAMALRENPELNREVMQMLLHAPLQEREKENASQTSWENLADILGPVEWSWPGWLAKGMLTILAGESGSGKSALALRIGSTYLRGDPWPDGRPFTGETGAIIWCEAEAAQALNLNRAQAWGLPIDKIYTPLSDPLADIDLDVPGHAAALMEKASLPEVRLIVVDSLRGIHHGDENSSETMETIKWLAELARDSHKELILTHHLRKRSIFDRECVELDRLRGSSAIVQAARLVWSLDVPSPQNKEIRRLQVIKSNLGKFPEPVGVTIDETGAKFVAIPTFSETESPMERAIELFLTALAKGPRPAKEMEQEFRSAGLSSATMNRAKARLGIVSGRNKNAWFWALPKEDADVD